MGKSTGKTLADFRSKYDRSVVVPNKIRTALQALLKQEGPQAWEMEGDFVKRAGVSQADISKYREEFVKHVVVVREAGKSERKVWFADARIASQVRA